MTRKATPTMELTITARHRRAINALSHVVDTGSYRPVMTCVHIEDDGDALRMAATDSYSAAVVRLHDGADGAVVPKGGVLLPARWFRDIHTLSMRAYKSAHPSHKKGAEWPDPVVTFTGDRVEYNLGGITAGTTTPGAGAYPSTRKLITDVQERPAVSDDTEKAIDPRRVRAALDACVAFGYHPGRSTMPLPMRYKRGGPMNPESWRVLNEQDELTILVMPVRVT